MLVASKPRSSLVRWWCITCEDRNNTQSVSLPVHGTDGTGWWRGCGHERADLCVRKQPGIVREQLLTALLLSVLIRGVVLQP